MKPRGSAAVVMLVVAVLSWPAEGSLQLTSSRLLDLHSSEHNMAARLSTRILAEDKRLADLSHRLSELTSAVAERDDVTSYLNNPLNALALFNRLQNYWTALSSLTGESSLLKAVRWPTAEVLPSVARTISRLQITYNLPTAQLVGGRLQDISVTSNMTAAACLAMARTYYSQHQHSQAVQWLNQALTKHDNTVPTATILELAVLSKCFSGNTHESLSTLHSLIRNVPSYEVSEKFLSNWQGVVFDGCDISKLFSTQHEKEASEYTDEDTTTYSRLCRGLEVSSDDGLKCRYVHYNQTRLRLGPFRLEELSLDPPVVIFHNVISDAEIQHLQEKARDVLGPSKVFSNEGPVVSTYRTSEVAWLWNSMSPTVDTVNRRIGDMTNLRLDTAEEAQVSRYGLGGEYKFHPDFFGHDMNNIGDRLATLMFYLSDVEDGGSTIFKTWNLNVRPQKGSAVFWFNLHRNGSSDRTSWHSGCPVITGSKWVMNKWFHELNNDLTLPCLQDPDATFKYFYL